MKDRQATVISNKEVASGIFEMVLCFDDFCEIKGGQFVDIQLPDTRHVLRRPFCICNYDSENKQIKICYAVVGQGTEELSQVKQGAKLNALLPLGNGYVPQGKKIMLIGGGMGSAVLPSIITANPDREYYTYLGFANKNKVVLEGDLAMSKQLTVATDDGSYGKSGFVTDIAREDIDKISPDEIFVCGPEVMYKAIKKTFAGVNIPIKISLEQRMGCGIGACLVCNCKVKKADGETYVRVCKDGPVFDLNEVVL